MLFLLLGGMTLTVTSACRSAKTSRCDEWICPAGSVCAASGDRCVLPEQIASCENLADDSACSYTGQTDGICIEKVCSSAGCGNFYTEEGEVCDDGNRLHGDGCSADCKSDESCGNGIVDQTVGESCDDPGPLCRSNCVSVLCGDGIVDPEGFEVCDDGEANSDAADGQCRLNCQKQRCGDGIIDDGEDCDDGNLYPGDTCSGACVKEECGNGVVDLELVGYSYLPSEDCDDGENSLNHDGCNKGCAREELRWRDLGSDVSPPARHSLAMAYDAARGRLVLFGGYGGSGVRLNDTWEWDGTNWSEVQAANAPPARNLHAMAYDAGRGRIVLFGGLGDRHSGSAEHGSPRLARRCHGDGAQLGASPV